MSQLEPIQQPSGEPSLEDGPSSPDIRVADRRILDPDILTIENKDPKRHYRWVRNNPTNITRLKLRGYRLESQTKGGVKTVVESDSHGDGAIARGDLILMSCPRELAEERIRTKFARSEALLASTTAATKEAARDKGITVIPDSDHGKETFEITERR